MVKIHGKEYAEVKDRIKLFRADHPDWSITTTMEWHAEGMVAVVFVATLSSPDEKQLFTGWAYEERVTGDTEVNFSAWVENCETSAIGRALANMGYEGTSQQGTPLPRPSFEEMAKVEKMKAAPAQSKLVIKKNLETTTKVKEDIIKAREALVKLMGHDKAYQQILANRDLKEADLSDLKSLNILQELRESMLSFISYIGDYLQEKTGKAGGVARDLPEDQKEAFYDMCNKLLMLG